MMSDEISQRKAEHLEIIQHDTQVDRHRAYFDDIRLLHRALPEISLDMVDPTVEVMGKRLAFPLLISSMTGGDDERARRINRNLAVAAQAAGVAMGVGSQRIMFDHDAARRSFAIRDYGPDCLLFANLGAVQLNYGFDADQCREAVAEVGADGLFLHLNPLQEAIQTEGNTDFSGLAEKIGRVAAALDVPLVLKEVGCGLSPLDAELALANGVEYLDVAGAGGTSWSRIEQQRKQRHGENSDDLGFAFQDWGLPTPVALRLLRPYTDRLTLFASGGLRNGLDMIKAVILGGRLCGLASPFLQPAMESAAAVEAVIHRLRREFVMAMFLLGARSVDDLWKNDSLLINS